MSRPKLNAMPHVEARKAEARQARLAAMGDPETFDCAACGLVGAGCFGFGRIRGVSEGLWACQDVDCRTEVRARVEAEKAAADALNRPQTPAPPATPSLDLFSRSEAA